MTPGPWKAEKGCRKEDEYWYSVSVNGEHQIARVYNRTMTDAHDDARLIAAAPELLESLEAMLNTQQIGYGHGNVTDAWVDVAVKARAAITKARGA